MKPINTSIFDFPTLIFDALKAKNAALAQCRERRYADAYAADGRKVVYVGVNYNPAARTFDDVRTEVAG